MGPRPNGRGKDQVIRRVSRSPSFNGAAAKRPRKDQAPPLAGQREMLQWGRGQTAAERLLSLPQAKHRNIASMGPRPNGRGKSASHRSSAPPSMLQWGRGQTAAERRAAGGGRRRQVLLQWGRGQTAAERRRRCGPAGGRGRASMGPRPNGRGKSKRAPNPQSNSKSFNGAAAKRPRKVFSPALLRRSRRSLQWGRGQTAAESRQMGVKPRDYLPSMGPRPNGRGKFLAAELLGPRFYLQWGRGQTAAERSRSQRPRAASQTFNGAAAKRPRKDAYWASGPIRRVLPSMGPRPNGRGKCVLGYRLLRNGNLQWGRGQTAAESGGHGPRLHLFTNAFNGAAAKRPRKVGVR